MEHLSFMRVKNFRIVQKDDTKFYIEKNLWGHKWTPHNELFTGISFSCFEEAEKYIKRICHEP